jgi:hypothetical protein
LPLGEIGFSIAVDNGISGCTGALNLNQFDVDALYCSIKSWKEVLGLPPWTITLDHCINHDIANFDLPHSRLPY